jgi:tetratricopeptide (TPR) repeat protein
MLELSKWDLDVETNDGEEYTSLVRAVRRNHQRFKLLFVSCSPSQGEKVRHDLMADIPAKKYELLDIKESIDNLYEVINNIPNLADLDVLFIRGLEYSIFEYEDQEFGDISKRSQSKVYGGSWAGVPPVLAKLNMQRELFRDRFPHICFVFLLPHFAIDYFIRRAPDFYDWKSGIYQFETDVEDLRIQVKKVFGSENYEQYFDLNNEDKLAKIRQIRSYIDEVKHPGLKCELLSQLSLLYSTLDRYLPDLDIVNRALQVIPNCYEDWYKGGIILRKLCRYEEAIDSFNRAIQYKSDRDEAWYNRGIALRKLGRYDKAIDSFDRAIQINPCNSETWYSRGNALYKLGRYEEAINSFDRAIQINSYNGEAWYNRGIVLHKLGRYEEAVNNFDRATQINPYNSETWYNRGNTLYKLDRYDEAINSFDLAIRFQPDDAKAWYNRGHALCKLGRYIQAINTFEIATQINPADSEAWYWHGYILHHLDKYKQALVSYDRSLQIKNDNYKTWFQRGNVLYKLGRYNESINSFDCALQIKPDYNKALFRRNNILNNLVGNYQDNLVKNYQDKVLAIFDTENYADALTSWKESFNIISKLKPSDTGDLIQEFLDEQLLPKFQQPAVRDILPQILSIYTTAQVLPELAVALTRNLKIIQSPSISDYTATKWLNMWQELGKPYPELALTLRMLEAWIKYKQNPTDDRVFLSLPQEMRPLLRDVGFGGIIVDS